MSGEAGEWDWAGEPTVELRRTARELHRNGGEEAVAQMRAEQGGLCWLCRRPLPEERHLVHVDHDHACCGPNRSCAACRRGLTHAKCNIVLAMASEDMDLLRAIITSYETMQPLVRQRIAARESPDLIGA